MAKFEIKKCFEGYCGRYKALLEGYYPAHGSTGFTERNQTVNFAVAVEVVYPQALTWYEAPIGKKNSEHLDAVIFIPELKATLLLEAKRFSNTNKKLKEVSEDIGRICDPQNLATVCEGLKGEYSGCGENAYGIILADVWPKEKGGKQDVFESWENESFFERFKDECPVSVEHRDKINSAVWLNHEHTFGDSSRHCLLALIVRVK